MRLLLLAAAIVAAAGCYLPASEALEPREIVRFHVTGEQDGGLRIGRAARLTADSVILEQCFRCSPLSYGRNEISGLEVFRGSTYGRNALAGFLAGALFGGGVAALIVNSETCTGDLCGLRFLAIPYGVLGGGLVGLFIGLRIGKETWEPAP